MQSKMIHKTDGKNLKFLKSDVTCFWLLSCHHGMCNDGNSAVHGRITRL